MMFQCGVSACVGLVLGECNFRIYGTETWLLISYKQMYCPAQTGTTLACLRCRRCADAASLPRPSTGSVPPSVSAAGVCRRVLYLGVL